MRWLPRPSNWRLLSVRHHWPLGWLGQQRLRRKRMWAARGAVAAGRKHSHEVGAGQRRKKGKQLKSDTGVKGQLYTKLNEINFDFESKF